MGRLQFLERLALGRSAFEDPLQEAELSNVVTNITEADPDQQSSTSYRQEYDSKGRPTKHATEERNQQLRNAQNAVLALVGVVESKENSEKLEKTKYGHIREARQALLIAEQDHGESLELLTAAIPYFFTAWPAALITRIQAGIYPSSFSFADIVLYELHKVHSRGLSGFMGTALPGFPAWLPGAVIRFGLLWLLEEGLGRLQGWANRRFHPSTAKWIYRITMYALDACDIGIHVALLPLQYYSIAQMLGLAPSRPYVLSWRRCLPYGQDSTHAFVWTSVVGIAALWPLCSPAALLRMKDYTQTGFEEETLIAGHLIISDTPGIDKPLSFVKPPKFTVHPVNRIFYEIYALRYRTLRWFGWNVSYIKELPPDPETYENNHIPQRPLPTHEHNREGDDSSSTDDDDDGLVHRHRSTSLAHLPITYLGERIEALYIRLLTLPLGSLMARSIAQSYLASSLPQTPQAIAAMANLYTPFGGGPLGLLRSSGFSVAAWRQLGSYVSKLGLSIALYFSAEVSIFFLVYRMCRREGIRYYDWGNADLPNPVRM